MERFLEGRVALVTGVGPNIGSGIALALARYGARVACVDMQSENSAACVARIERNGGTAMALTGDVTDEKDVVRYVGEVLEAWGGIDILVNNAAMMGGYAGVMDEDGASFAKAVLVTGLGSLLNT